MEAIDTSGSTSLDAGDVLAIVLSVIAPGVGHMLVGQPGKGLLILALVVGSCGVGYVVSVLIALDVYLVARVRRHRPVGEWEILPEHQSILGI